jgi:hypothetical protein
MGRTPDIDEDRVQRPSQVCNPLSDQDGEMNP